MGVTKLNQFPEGAILTLGRIESRAIICSTNSSMTLGAIEHGSSTVARVSQSVPFSLFHTWLPVLASPQPFLMVNVLLRKIPSDVSESDFVVKIEPSSNAQFFSTKNYFTKATLWPKKKGREYQISQYTCSTAIWH